VGSRERGINLDNEKRDEIADLIEWSENEEKTLQEIADNSLDMGWEDDIKDIQQMKENFRKVRAVLEIVLDRPVELW
jgi:hypothetical protein